MSAHTHELHTQNIQSSNNGEDGLERGVDQLLASIEFGDPVDEERCLEVKARFPNDFDRLPEPRLDRDFMEVHGVGAVSYTHLTLPTKRIV